MRKPLLLASLMFCIAFCDKLFAQTAPSISYITPQTFTVGVPIAPLKPLNTGGNVLAAAYGTVTTFAGTSGTAGHNDGAIGTATFNTPLAMLADATGNLFVLDAGNNCIRKITPAGIVSTFAGSLTGATGSANGTGTAATFNGLNGITIDDSNNLYVTEQNNDDIRKITPAGVVTTLATVTTGDGPAGLTFDPTKTFLYVTTQNSHVIRKVTVATGAVASTPYAGTANSSGLTNGTTLTNSKFNAPVDLQYDASNNLYIIEYGNNTLRKIANGATTLTTFAGSTSGASGSGNGTGTAARFKTPYGLAIDGAGNLYVGDYGNNEIRAVTTSGAVVTLFAGTGAAGSGNGTFATATFNGPADMYISTAGVMYLADFNTHIIRQLQLSGYTISPSLPAGLSFDVTTGTITGTPTTVTSAANYTIVAHNYYGVSSTTVSIATAAAPSLSYSPTTHTYPAGTAVSLTPTNSGGAVPAGAYATVSRISGSSSGAAGSVNSTRLNSTFSNPTGITIEATGIMYVADKTNNQIRKIPATGNVTTLAGAAAAGNVDNTTPTSARFNGPSSITTDGSGILYVADQNNHEIRKIIASTGAVSTLAGNGTSGTTNSTGSLARFNLPAGVIFDPFSGNIYVADQGNNQIRRVTPAGVVTLVAGNASGTAGHADGTGTSATFNAPTNVAVDASGNIYVTDKGNNLIRKIIAATGVVSTVAGDWTVSPATSVDGNGTAANFNAPYGITIDKVGVIYISESTGNKIRRLYPNGDVGTIAGSGAAGLANAVGTAATFSGPAGLDVEPTTGNIQVTDASNNEIRQIIGTGFSINPTVLPLGLTFTATTGKISGTPTTTTAGVDYTITGFNVAGSSSAVVTIGSVLNVPSISYTTPSSFLVTTAIGTAPNSSLTPTVAPSGGSVPATTYGTVSTFVGAATVTTPRGLASDGAGNLFEADFTGNKIIMFNSSGSATTVAGTTTAGEVDGIGTVARFNNPSDIVYDGSTYLYIVDNGGHTIRQMTVTSPYTVNTIAGLSATPGEVDNATGTSARFNKPYGIAYDPAGFLYVTDAAGNTVRKISTTAPFAVTTLASTGLNGPSGIAYDGSANLYIANTTGNNILTLPAAGGTPSTFAGSGTAGSANGTGTAATFKTPYGVVFDASGNLMVSDQGNSSIRAITPAGVVTTIASSVGTPYGVTVDNLGNLFVGDQNSNTLLSTIRKVLLTGYTISPALPTGVSFSGTTGAFSGKPSGTSPPPIPATDYLVTAYNGSGSGTTTVNITWYRLITWTGASSGVWTATGNWSGAVVPSDGDRIQIGTAAFTNYPIIAANTNIGSIIFGTAGGATKPPGISVNSGMLLKVSGDITYQSNNTGATGTNSTGSTGNPATLSGAGSISASNIIISSSPSTGTATYPMALTSSVTNLNLTGNIALTSTKTGGTNLQNSTFTITGGTVKAAGNITTANAAGSTSTLSVTGGVLSVDGLVKTATTGTSTIAVSGGRLKWNNANPLSGLTAGGTNNINLTGGWLEYSGADQNVYSSTGVANLNGGGLSYNSLAFSGSGVKTLAPGNLNIAADFTNGLISDGTTNYADLSGGTVNFTGTAQTLVDSSTTTNGGTGTKFYNVNFSGAGTKTLSSGIFSVDVQGVLSLTGTNTLTKLDAGASLLTLNSDINGSATVAALKGPSILGTVNVQRFMTGQGDLTYRGYRLLSSPVADVTSPSYSYYNLSYLLNSGTAITGAYDGGFDIVSNPTLYLFREDLTPIPGSVTGTNYRAITKVNNTNKYSLSVLGETDKSLGIGNGYLFFFRGNPSTNITTPPNDITLVASGRLNQGDVTVKPWFTGSSNLAYTNAVSTDPRYGIKGFNLVGNPYASSINWNAAFAGTTTSGIYAPNVSPTIYIWNASTKNYDSYINTSATAGTSINGMTNVIPQGQGFFVRALSSSAQLIFHEDAKITDQPDQLLLNASANPVQPQRLRLQLYKDRINKDETVLQFSNTAHNGYLETEDAAYFRGTGVVSLSHRVTDNIPIAISQLPLPKTALTVPLSVLVATSGTYQLKLTEATNIPPMYDVWLMDNYMKDSLDIKANPNYSFNTSSDTASYGANRFKLVIRQNGSGAVRLLNFTAVKQTADVKITWNVENEADYTQYVLQRSTDGGHTFTTLDSLTSNGSGTYNDLDPHPVKGLNNYRLKQIDVLGNISYSAVVQVDFTGSGALPVEVNNITVYPNPVKQILSIVIKPASTKATDYKVTITNNMGIIVKSGNTILPLWLENVSGWLPGTYFVNVVDTKTNTLLGRTTFIKL